jgi:hypothetical protein
MTAISGQDGRAAPPVALGWLEIRGKFPAVIL